MLPGFSKATGACLPQGEDARVGDRRNVFWNLLTVLETTLLLTDTSSLWLHIPRLGNLSADTFFSNFLFWGAKMQLSSATIICCSSLTASRGEDCRLLKPDQGLEWFFLRWGYFAKNIRCSNLKARNES